MRTLLWLLISACALASCGGESGGNGNGTTPAPNPSPTPSPSPLAFTGEISEPLVGSMTFADNNGTATVPTGRDGVAPAGTSPLPGSPILQPVTVSPPYATATFSLSATGVETTTGYLSTQAAPVGATTVSPLTSLIAITGSQSIVRSTMMLNTGDAYAVPADLNLLTYSASRNQPIAAAERTRGGVMAANLRIRALSQAVNLMGLPTIDHTIVPQVPVDLEPKIGQWLKDNAGVRLFAGGGTETFLRGNVTMSGIYPIYDETYAAVAHLLDIYAEALKNLEAHPELAPRYSAALQGFLSEEVRRVARFNYNDRSGNLSLKSAAARALALTTADVVATAAALDVPATTAINLFSPGIDFISIAGGAATVVSRHDARLSPGGTGAKNPSFGDNDYVWNAAALKWNVDDGVTVTGAVVPTAFTGKLAVSNIGASAFTVQPVGGFTGIGYVDLSVTSSNGERRIERVFIIAS